MRLAIAALGALALACTPAPAPTSTSPLPPPAIRVRLSPGSSGYWTRSYLTVEQEVGGQVQESRLVLAYFLTAMLAGDSTGLDATLVLDSVTRYEGNAAVATDVPRARGATFRGRLAAGGELSDFRGGDSSVQFIRELRDELRRFFPVLPRAGGEPGVQWVDTTEQRSASSGVPLIIRSIAHHEVGEIERREGEQTLPVRTRATYSFGGTGTQGGQAFSVEGSGHRETVEFVSLDGRYRGLVATDSSAFTITLSVSGMQIAGRQARADTVSILP